MIEEPILPVNPARPSFALWNLGFRPFYLLAAHFCRAVDSAVDLPIRGRSSRRFRARSDLARPRDAVWLHARRHRRLPFHRGSQLDRTADAVRRRAGRVCAAVDRRQSPGADALRRRFGDRECRVSRGGRGRDRNPAHPKRQHPQLLFHRDSAAGRPRRRSLSIFPISASWTGPRSRACRLGSTSSCSSWR